MKITYLGTTVLLLDDGQDQLLFDAFFSRVSLFQAGFGRLSTDPAVVDRIAARYPMDRLRGIFISHTHMDHVLDAPYLANKTGAELYGSVSALNVARGGQVPEERLHCYDDEKSCQIGAFHVRVLPSVHSQAHWYNDDLGKVITEPLVQPASKKAYREGGSYDFVVEHSGKTYLIRPSFNYIPGQLEGIRADVLFLGIGGLSKAKPAMKERFFAETVERTGASLVLPLHWDNFFKPLEKASYLCPGLVDHTERSLYELAAYCGAHGVHCAVQLPLTTLEL